MVDTQTNEAPVPHPAKFTDRILETIADMLTPYTMEHLDYHGYRPFTVLDPFGGVGKVFQLESVPGDIECWMIELEPEWASQSPVPERTIVGDAIEWMHTLASHQQTGPTTRCATFRAEQWRTEWRANPDDETTVPFDYQDVPTSFDAIVTSPVYGNRMSDHHNARDDSRRHTYRHYLGRPLTEGNSGMLQWGKKYREFHTTAWRLATQLVRPGGLFVLNVSDHIRKGKVERVAAWHLKVLMGLGWTLEQVVKVPTPRQRHGENSNLRVDGEMVYVLRRST